MSQKGNASYNALSSRGGYALSIGNGQIHDAVSPSYEVCKTLNCMKDPMKVLVIENHPADSRVKVSEDGIFQTLSGRMGTGGGQRTNDYGKRR